MGEGNRFGGCVMLEVRRVILKVREGEKKMNMKVKKVLDIIFENEMRIVG